MTYVIVSVAALWVLWLGWVLVNDICKHREINSAWLVQALKKEKQK